MGKFEKGNPGKPKGAVTKTSLKARELFTSIMEGQMDNVQSALEEVREDDRARYLDLLSKFLPYFIPKKVEIDVPHEMVINVKRKA